MENKLVKEFLQQDSFKGDKAVAKEAIFFFFKYLRAVFRDPNMESISIMYFGKFKTGLKKLKSLHKQLTNAKNKTEYTYEKIRCIERKIEVHNGRMFESDKKRAKGL